MGLLKDVRAYGLDFVRTGSQLKVIGPEKTVEQLVDWITEHRDRLFNELMREEFRFRIHPDDLPAGLPEDEDFWIGTFVPDIDLPEIAGETETAEEFEFENQREASRLLFHLEVSLVIANQQSQRSSKAAQECRRGLRIWRERECRLRFRGFTGCIRGVDERCRDRQVLWCSHCREVAQKVVSQ